MLSIERPKPSAFFIGPFELPDFQRAEPLNRPACGAVNQLGKTECKYASTGVQNESSDSPKPTVLAQQPQSPQFG
jgi:hypothetical protein